MVIYEEEKASRMRNEPVREVRFAVVLSESVRLLRRSGY
jgi:hypothetical protein